MAVTNNQHPEIPTIKKIEVMNTLVPSLSIYYKLNIVFLSFLIFQGCQHVHTKLDILFILVACVLWWLMSLSTIFQLFGGG